jgi:hypothetical protein
MRLNKLSHLIDYIIDYIIDCIIDCIIYVHVYFNNYCLVICLILSTHRFDIFIYNYVVMACIKERLFNWNSEVRLILDRNKDTCNGQVIGD